MRIRPYSTFQDIPTDGYSLVAPFYANTDMTTTGTVHYQTFSGDEEQTNMISSFITSTQGASFDGSWMLVADWFYLPEFGGSTVIEFAHIPVTISHKYILVCVLKGYLPF